MQGIDLTQGLRELTAAVMEVLIVLLILAVIIVAPAE